MPLLYFLKEHAAQSDVGHALIAVAGPVAANRCVLCGARHIRSRDLDFALDLWHHFGQGSSRTRQSRGADVPPRASLSGQFCAHGSGPARDCLGHTRPHRPGSGILNPRGVYGAYLADIGQKLLISGAIRHVRERCINLTDTGHVVELALASGKKILASLVVLATGTIASTAFTGFPQCSPGQKAR